MPRRYFAENRTCERCGLEYATRSPVQRFCSRRCAAKEPRPGRKRTVIEPKTCACGTEFVPSVSRQRYCSLACARTLERRSYPKECVHCSTPFTAKTAWQLFCSQRCLVKARIARTSRNCEKCGEKFTGFDKRRRFCSRECAYANQRLVRGSKRVNWRGGRTISKQHGYVWTRAEGHPRTRAKWPYVLEHILVMERGLGRYLLAHERVHHKNGRRDDNRPENLELWKIKDPAGVRAIDYHCAGCVCDGQPVVLLSPDTTFTEAA